jgi:hypothetical protein
MAHMQRPHYGRAMADEFEFGEYDEDEEDLSEEVREDQFGSDFDDDADSVSHIFHLPILLEVPSAIYMPLYPSHIISS